VAVAEAPKAVPSKQRPSSRARMAFVGTAAKN